MGQLKQQTFKIVHNDGKFTLWAKTKESYEQVLDINTLLKQLSGRQFKVQTEIVHKPTKDTKTMEIYIRNEKVHHIILRKIEIATITSGICFQSKSRATIRKTLEKVSNLVNNHNNNNINTSTESI